jgi:hypothetical protein
VGSTPVLIIDAEFDGREEEAILVRRGRSLILASLVVAPVADIRMDAGQVETGAGQHQQVVETPLGIAVGVHGSPNGVAILQAVEDRNGAILAKSGRT